MKRIVSPGSPGFFYFMNVLCHKLKDSDTFMFL